MVSVRDISYLSRTLWQLFRSSESVRDKFNFKHWLCPVCLDQNCGVSEEFKNGENGLT